MLFKTATPMYVIIDPRLLQQLSRRSADSVDSPNNHLMDPALICLAKVNINNQQGSVRVMCFLFMLGLYPSHPLFELLLKLSTATYNSPGYLVAVRSYSINQRLSTPLGGDNSMGDAM
jgi:hypothetical protein